MTIYNIYAEIKTNAVLENLYYEMEVYKTDWNNNRTHALKPTGKHPIKSDSIEVELPQMHPKTDQLGNPIKKTRLKTVHQTQLHSSLDIADPAETCYILAIDIYRKVGNNFIKVTPSPMTAIIPLKGFLTDNKAWGASREFEYYETIAQTQKKQQGQASIVQLNISSKPRIFEAEEHPIGDPLDPFTKQKVEDELKIRMTRPALTHVQVENLSVYDIRSEVLSFPFQNRSMFCGPAAFFYCVQQDRPDIYQQLIKELWETGETKIGALKIEADSSVRYPKNFFRDNGFPMISAIDWITMASLRDSENALFSINSPNPGLIGLNWAGAVTMWGVLEKWFNKVGATTIYSNISIAHSNLQDICTLNNYVTPHNHVVSLIGAGMLSKGGDTKFKNHWIVWEDKLRLLNGTPVTASTPLSETVKLTLFSWGEVYEQLKKTLSLGEFLNHTYGGLVFKKIP